VLAWALEQLTPSIRSTAAQITYDELPTLCIDAAQLARVFQNLLHNAVKFNVARPPLVHVAARRAQAGWVLSVADNGIGIHPRHHARVFEMFRRLHSREEYAGDGIGLAICRRIVERHGGRIWIEPSAEGGSVFYFRIPDGDRRPSA
jgi:light-regulated signal transduction histidine kinase (bacteriophytochrome)